MHSIHGKLNRAGLVKATVCLFAGQVSLLINAGSSLIPDLILMTLHWIMQSTMALSPLS